MNMKTKILLIALASFLLYSTAFAQDGVKFQYTDVEEAIKETASDQHIFVDLYATWCGPCLMMDKQIFPLKHVGDYINSNFVTCRIDADSKAGQSFMKQHNIDKLPTLVVIDGDGKAIKISSGAMDDYGLIRFCKEAKGEVIDMEKLYKMHRGDKNNTDLMQSILLEAPYFMQTVTSENQMKKWGLRINDLFNLYVKTKGVENMTNMTDFGLLTRFHNYYEKDDKIIEKIIRHFPEFTKSLNEKAVGQFVTGTHINYIISLAQTCNEEYKKELSRITSDMMHVYSVNQNDTEGFKMSLQEFCEAACALSKKDMTSYAGHMDKYFATIPDIAYNDYASAIEAVYNGLNEKLDDSAAKIILRWGQAALDLNPNQVEAKAPLYMVIGDAHKQLGDRTKAREMYDQAFQYMMKSQQQRFIQGLQPQISKRIEDLAQ